MRSFKDNKDRTWDLEINVFAVKRVRSRLGIDLLALLGPDAAAVSEKLADPCTLCDVLWVLCEAQAGERKLSDEDFGRALFGDALRDAGDAFTEEMIDFFPRQKLRDAWRKASRTGEEGMSLLLDEAAAKAEALTPADVARILRNSSGNSPASPASTPDPGPSGKSP